MPDEQDTIDFIRASFGSVWTLELLLLLLAAEPEKAWAHHALVDTLRASDLIVVQSVDELASARLIGVRPDRTVQYAPGSAGLDELTTMARELYGRSPDMVRRTIVEAISRD